MQYYNTAKHELNELKMKLDSKDKKIEELNDKIYEYAKSDEKQKATIYEVFNRYILDIFSTS